MPDKKIINFMGQRYIAAALSLLLILGSIVSLSIKGLNFGLDFTGGMLIEVSYPKAPVMAETPDRAKS